MPAAAPIAAGPAVKPLPAEEEPLPEEKLTLIPLPDSGRASSFPVFLLAAELELGADFDADVEDDERLPARPASLALETVISSAATRIWIAGAAFMNASLFDCGPQA